MINFLKFLLFLLPFNMLLAHPLFSYDLHLTSLAGKSSKIMILAHGMGGNYQIIHSIKTNHTLVSFNFPDYDYGKRMIKPETTTYGTIDELLPFLYVIKKYVVIDGNQEIDLYGFSAGGGAIINMIGLLNSHRYETYLRKIGIFQKEKEVILQAIQKGVIILDCPLKSLQEIIDFRGSTPELNIFAKRYQKNKMDPIETLIDLKGLSLQIILHFQDPDEILSNRDDHLFFTLLKKYNQLGTTQLIVGKDGGHNTFHHSLWNFYSKEYQ